MSRTLGELVHDSHAYCESVLKEGKRVVGIVAHLNVILNMSGKAQVDEAAALIAKNTPLMPTPLFVELKAIVDKVAGKGRKRKAGE